MDQSINHGLEEITTVGIYIRRLNYKYLMIIIQRTSLQGMNEWMKNSFV